MFPPQTTDRPQIRFARLRHGVVAAVEVLALLQLVLQQVLLVWKLAVQAEELLLLFGEGLPGTSAYSQQQRGCEVGCLTLMSTLFF